MNLQQAETKVQELEGALRIAIKKLEDADKDWQKAFNGMEAGRNEALEEKKNAEKAWALQQDRANDLLQRNEGLAQTVIRCNERILTLMDAVDHLVAKGGQ